jgi:hypothetical protein
MRGKNKKRALPESALKSHFHDKVEPFVLQQAKLIFHVEIVLVSANNEEEWGRQRRRRNVGVMDV